MVIIIDNHYYVPSCNLCAHRNFILVLLGQQDLGTSLNLDLALLWVFICSISPKILSINKKAREQEAKYFPPL